MPGLYADLALARRIEAAEAEHSAGIATAIRDRGELDGVLVSRPAGGVAALVRPASPINKIIGVGFEPGAAEAIAALEPAFFARGARVRVEVSTLADPALAAELTGRGYRLVAFEHVLGRDLADAPAPVPGPVAIEDIGADDLAAWGQVMTTGFSVPDGTGAGARAEPEPGTDQVMNDFAADRSPRRYLARLDGAPAGAAVMRLVDGVAILSGATTLPAVRRRGVQQALFAHRLDAARTAGCDLAVVTTTPGSRSEANAARKGFRVLYARAVLSRTPP